MATIQVRDLPPEVHRIYRVRAAAAGMSLQEYVRTEMVRNASLRDPSELAAEVERQIRQGETEGYAHGSSAEVVRTDREAH
ncbi:MAG: FitA-like ribbon-helix-helix domain-containing protein [Acidimicrobiales bacterium]